MLDAAKFSGKRVTIMGLGTFGGGLGAVQFFLKQGALVTLTDLRDEVVLKESLSQIDLYRLQALVLEQHRDEDFSQADIVVVNPAVRMSGNRYLELAHQHGAHITSEMNLFWELCPARKIVVTGTVGKSTTTMLIYEGLKQANFSVRVGGNLGVSLLPVVDQITSDEWIVLELSSFQLAALDSIRCQPHISVLTNFSPNHLDWHGKLEHYAWSKQTALRWQTNEQFAVINADCELLARWEGASKRIEFGSNPSCGHSVKIGSDAIIVLKNSQQTLSFDDLAANLQFPHQYENVAAAVATLCLGVGLSLEQVRPALLNYRALPHRFEVVQTSHPFQIINDSKATTPEAAIAALKSLSGSAVLIAGGKDKQVDLSELCACIARRLTNVALIGDTAIQMQRLILLENSNVDCQVYGNLSSAVSWALERTKSRETLLFSPGCASHAEFSNYEDRGNQFRTLVLSKV